MADGVDATRRGMKRSSVSTASAGSPLASAQARRGGADHDPRLVHDRREGRLRTLQVPALHLQARPHRGEGDLFPAQHGPAVAMEGLGLVERTQRLTRRAGRGTHARIEVGDHEVQLAAPQQRGGNARLLEMEGGLGRPQS